MICVVVTAGCNRPVLAGPDIEHATRVTFEQLKEATQNEIVFQWFGSDKDFHYFKTQQGFYRLAREFELPQILKRHDRGEKPGTRIVEVLIHGDNIVYASDYLRKQHASRLNVP